VTAQTWAEALILAASVVVSMLASATETALTSVGRLRVRHLAEEGSESARALQQLQRDPNRFLSTVLIVNTVALIVAASTATLLSVEYLPPRYQFWGGLAVSLVLSILLLIFAEVTPKTIAIRYAERIALVAAGPVNFLASVLRPVIWLTTLVARLLFRGRGATRPFVTEDELMTILHVSEEQGVIEQEERQMMRGIIEIGDKTVREVMVPRTDITAIDRSSGVDELVEVYRQHRHTRMPVYEGDLDHIIGLIHAKDLLLYFVEHRQEPFQIERMLRPIKFTPEQKMVDELLHQMQVEKVHMMIVVDEYGGTAGLVTLEDLLEEIVGEIRDEYDQAEEEPLRVISDREALVDARLPMDTLNDRLDLGIAESDEYDSVGGYVNSVLGEIPEAGASFLGGRARWTVEKVNGRRVLEVRLTSKEPWPDDALVAANITPPSRDDGAEDGPDKNG
jgi:CBS domain containing-hemolysin-like protein